MASPRQRVRLRELLGDVWELATLRLKYFLDITRIQFGGPGSSQYPHVQAWGREAFGDSAMSSTAEPYRSDPTVCVGVNAIAEDGASVPWEIVRRRNPPRVLDDHPVADVLARPNEQMVGDQLWVASYISYELFGECWWWYPTARLGRRIPGLERIQTDNQLYLLDPRAVVLDEDGWKLRVGGETIPLEPERTTLFKRWNPYGVRGLSKIESVIREVAGDRAAAEWNLFFFSEKNAVPTGIIAPPLGINPTPSEKEELSKKVNEKAGGTRRSFLMLPGGWTWNALGLSQKDMDFRALRDHNRELILGALGVPPFIAGVLDRANYANARKQEELYWQQTITRLLRRFQAVLNEDFLPKVGAADVELRPKWAVIRVLTEDLADKTKIAATWFGMGVTKRTINERLEMGWDPAQMDDYEQAYLESKYKPVEQALDPPEPQPQLPPTEEDEDERALRAVR